MGQKFNFYKNTMFMVPKHLLPPYIVLFVSLAYWKCPKEQKGTFKNNMCLRNDKNGIV